MLKNYPNLLGKCFGVTLFSRLLKPRGSVRLLLMTGIIFKCSVDSSLLYGCSKYGIIYVTVCRPCIFDVFLLEQPCKLQYDEPIKKGISLFDERL